MLYVTDKSSRRWSPVDIASLAISMNQAQLMQNVSIAVAGKAMEMQQMQAEQLVEVMETSQPAAHPYLGASIDISI